MRHAWLILTHGNFEILEKQLRFLDSENADFFIHVDAKADFDEERFSAVTERSRVTFVPRRRISWGHFAIAEAELELWLPGAAHAEAIFGDARPELCGKSLRVHVPARSVVQVLVENA